jgi:hypothetical protein
VVTIAFEAGVPVSVDGKRLGPVALVEELNRIAGAHGVGRLDLVENRLVGIKSAASTRRRPAPSSTSPHREIERLVLDRDTLHFKQSVSVRYAQLIYDGLWFSTLRQALAAFVDYTEREVTGEVRVQLFKGRATAISRRSPRSLYRQDLATFGEGMSLRPRRRGGLHPPVRAAGAGPRPRRASTSRRRRRRGRRVEHGAASTPWRRPRVTAPRGFRAGAVASGIKADRAGPRLAGARTPV